MKSIRKNLPPLDSLIFFLSVAKHGSFTAAASALFVTQAAASKRVQRLEEWLGTPLFDRVGRGISLNSSGRTLARDVELALDFLERSVAMAKTPEQPTVHIAASGSISMFWLYERLKQFSLSENACHVSVTTSDELAKLTDDSHDLTIIYNENPMPGWTGVKIVAGELAPAATPEVARQADAAGAFTDGWDTKNSPPILEYSNLTPDWINWAVWLKRMKLPEIGLLKVTKCAGYAQSVGRGLAGHGILLANLELQKPELASGRLVRIGQMQLSPKESYYLCYKSSKELSPSALALFEFLRLP
ncbi:LysR family transcriptional regulator [Mesorhizobium sp. NPDC059054]|uniref:LysR family transcriptional regulator n=1 Tax=Mesorhizobium sp. NPDC059054 TaxID=3346711 RepID=UPI0036CD88CD